MRYFQSYIHVDRLGSRYTLRQQVKLINTAHAEGACSKSNHVVTKVCQRCGAIVLRNPPLKDVT